MTTKGYHRYRGRNTRGKVALVVVLVLILLAAVAYLLTQEYVVYDDEGKAHLELPWSRKEPEKPSRTPRLCRMMWTSPGRSPSGRRWRPSTPGSCHTAAWAATPAIC